MQVALDYYRILMVPIQEGEPQIEQAYRERTQLSRTQHPWSSFSPQAWQARERLLDEAATVLLDPQRRQDYDADLTAMHGGLDLEGDLVLGALMILCETGDFQGAQELAVTVLNHHYPSTTDAVLTVAIARLEMGREAWQKGAYEEAAEWLRSALIDLETYQAFAEMQGEIQVDLGKLRPYRILNLLAIEEDSSPERERGLMLLREMLDERGGIEGNNEDRSGLSTEDFLRFIQRVRHQLTIAEQEALFTQEADRPSLVGAYLAAQVLMVRGYVENRPALVRRSRGYLQRLARHQDVFVEQAICSLLLGQTEEALEHLHQTEEEDPLAFIQEHSAAAPDQLPGLCRYTERWFSEEVFSEFRHLEVDQANLQAYFDNPQVQAYLEEMPVVEEPEPPRWSVSMPTFTRPTPPAPIATAPEPPPPESAGSYEPSPYVEEEPVSEPALNFAGSRYGEDRSLSSSALGVGRHSQEIASTPSASLYPDNSTPYPSTAPSEFRSHSTVPPNPPSEYSDAGPYRRQEGSEAETTRPRGPGRRRLSPRSELGFPSGPLVVVVGLGVAGLVIWQMLTIMFRPASTPVEDSPLATVSSPPVDLPSATPTTPPPSTPTPSPTPDVPAEWQGISQVRVISNTGLNIRQQPTVQSPVVTGAAGQAVLAVLDVEETTSPTTPIWVQVQVGGTTGWAAAELSGTPLLERLP